MRMQQLKGMYATSPPHLYSGLAHLITVGALGGGGGEST